ncbi:MAG: bifunctional UDP-3-O-[3-hydroxymyristoyl] N-acetylglucosamine deacetylase/3-hydroxyacyl-ACP dehydratase [Candidatus Omnitrophota bacterium]
MDAQRTIQKEAVIKGFGLHTAGQVTMILKPAGIDEGINFIRTDLPQRPKIKVCAQNLLSPLRSPRRTSVGEGDVEVHTIEHLMAALVGLGIDNVNIEVDNNEVPGLDGSSLKFIELLEGVGIIPQAKDRQPYILREPVFVEDGSASIVAVPCPEYKISYTLSYDHPFLRSQFMEVNINSGMFKQELASSRTFCLESEASELQDHGMGLGANYENTLVVGKNGIIKNKLRYEDEFIRHKILDLLGDLYVLGVPLKAHIIALKSGHSLNLKFLKKVAQQKQKYALGGIGISYYPQDGQQLDVEMIMKILPHREPFLFVDRIISLDKGKHAVGIKNVTINDYFFKGHFPGKPVMPGVLIIEAMAQVGGVMMLAAEENRGKLAYFMAMDNVKFRKTVVPGDQLVFDITAGKIKSRTGQVHGKAFVDGKVVAEADLMFALVVS